MPTMRRTSSSTSSTTRRIRPHDRRSRSFPFSLRPVSRFIFDRGAKMTLGMAAMAGVMSCEIGKITVDKPDAQIVVHRVLNPNALNQVLSVDQTLTGTITVPGPGFSPTDPILSGGGVPISDAIV